MSTDRELLEAAAKAAGMTLGAWSERRLAFMYRAVAPGSGYWNPLTDDGDAFRLYVALKMDVFVRHEWAEAVGPMGAPQKVWYGVDADPAAATRRAIVRAAAALAQVPR